MNSRIIKVPAYLIPDEMLRQLVRIVKAVEDQLGDDPEVSAFKQAAEHELKARTLDQLGNSERLRTLN